MSISLVLVPIVIALTVTVKKTAIEGIRERGDELSMLDPILTIFSDTGLLVKTLEEHGLPVSVISDDKVLVKSNTYELHYNRANPGEAFYVSASGWNSPEELLAEFHCLENEYKSNVQSYTYNKLLKNLSASKMTVESETVLEDNSILLTVNF